MKDESHRFYRFQHQNKKGWATFEVRYRETDLWIRARRNVQKEALEAVLNYRHQLEQYIARFPDFLHSLVPLPDAALAPPLICRMLRAARMAGVGPMAGVAGAMAEFVALNLKAYSESIVIENGGDCFFDIDEEIKVGIYAGERSPFSGRLAIRLTPERFPLGICTSSGTVGHSLSFGKADAVTVLCKDTALADATATALGNLVQGPRDIAAALDRSTSIPSIEGVLILVGSKMGVRGNIELVPW
jgi:ApbE superfamily uncharacterized protein (UPF0280 family)